MIDDGLREEKLGWERNRVVYMRWKVCSAAV